jgi:glycosyltransferase involved in cell wall biosynthesis
VRAREWSCMKVLKVTQSYFPFVDRGGPAVKVRALARGLASRGESVTVLTADLGLERVTNSGNGWIRERGGWRSCEDSVEIVYLKSSANYRSVTWNPGIFAFCRERLASFDVVHIYGLYDLLGPVVARACGRRELPYVVEPMGMFRPIVRNIALKKVYRHLMGNSMARGARRVLATSEQEQRELVEEGLPARQIVVRRNGIERPERLPAPGAFRAKWHVPENARIVLFLGRLVAKKSPDLLIEAFARWQTRDASESAAPAILVIAGPDEGGYQKKLEAIAARLGLSKTVLFPGPLFDDAKWSAYRDADLFVLPSQNENFGNAVAEAVACGTPALVTDQCGVAPLVDGRAGLVVRHDSDALTAALERLFAQPGLREKLKQGCAGVAQSLSWQEPLDATQALYAELIREKQS